VQVEWIYENGTREKGDPEKGGGGWLFNKSSFQNSRISMFLSLLASTT
jgi:hypothetical protein